MAKRIKIIFDRNNDDTAKYNIYRAIEPEVTQSDELILEVAQPESGTNTIQVENEELSTSDYLTYEAYHKKWIEDDTNYPIVVTVNDTVQETDYTIDYENGQIIFDVALNSDDIVKASYFYDGVMVLDDDGEQEGVTFLGSVAIDDVPPIVPQDPSIIADNENNQAIISWEEITDQGRIYFYKVEAEDEAGNKSTLSTEASAEVTEGLDDLPYIVEVSSDNGETWSIYEETSDLQVLEELVDDAAPDTVTDLTSSITLNSDQGTGDVQLSWTNPESDKGSMSAIYRIKSKDAAGNESDYTAELGPVEVISGLQKIVIKRKLDDGTYPTFEDESTVVTEITDFNVDSYDDLNLDDQSIYNYSIFVIDNADNISTAATVQADIGDATSPDTVTGVEAE